MPGFRREELLWLTLNDIDLKAGGFGMIRVRAKKVNSEFWQPKTKINRAVPVSSSLRYYLDRYAPRLSNDRWYFPSPEGKRWDADNFSQDLAAANTKAGLRWGGCLDYRHTFGSQLAMKGESLYKVSTMMGNSPEICRRHYAALIPEQLFDSVEFIKQFFDYRADTNQTLLVVVFFALGLMSKPMLVTLPFVLLLLDYWPLERLNTKLRCRIYSLRRFRFLQWSSRRA
jgi:hypothetical protein